MKLWDYDHPYYMNEGCFFKSGLVNEYSCWADFLSEWKDSDVDMNRIHRWDFNEEHTEATFYYIIQRKAYTLSCSVRITPEDHDAIREFLKPHAELNQQLWAGVLDSASKDSEEMNEP